MNPPGTAPNLLDSPQPPPHSPANCPKPGRGGSLQQNVKKLRSPGFGTTPYNPQTPGTRKPDPEARASNQISRHIVVSGECGPETRLRPEREGESSAVTRPIKLPVARALSYAPLEVDDVNPKP